MCACLLRHTQLHVPVQVDPKEAQTAALKREVQLLRAENAYLRDALTASGASTASSQVSTVGSVSPAVPGDPSKATLGQPSKQPTAEVSLYACHQELLIE